MASRAAFARPTRVPTLVFRWRPTAVVPSGGIGGDDLGQGLSSLAYLLSMLLVGAQTERCGSTRPFYFCLAPGAA